MLRPSLCAPFIVLRPCSLLPPSPYQCIPASSLFHTTSTFRDDNHYETLRLAYDASAADIKRQFYSLSKTHHPDHNRNDPSAAQRFVKISEAYAILGSPQKREQYDRQVFRSSSSGRSGSGHRSSTFSSSTGPFGGRPASGLSRRRTQFRGPPPSFYRSGGWGVHARKRQAQANATAAAAAAAAAAHNARAAQQEGEGIGHRSTTHHNEKNFTHHELYDEDLPYFDRASHYRTQQQQEGRRRMRRRMADDDDIPRLDTESPPSLLRSFLLVGGILTLSMGISSVFTGVHTSSDSSIRNK